MSKMFSLSGIPITALNIARHANTVKEVQSHRQSDLSLKQLINIQALP